MYSKNKPVYLDYAATTPVAKEVIEAMKDYLSLDGCFGNASSRHFYGKQALTAIQKAREQVASLIKAQPDEIIFTSGATEADNLAIKGIVKTHSAYGKHIITTKIEHKAVLESCRELEKEGYRVTYLTPNQDGIITPEELKANLCKDTILVSIMLINNETGMIQPIHELVKETQDTNIIFHCDAAQAIGKITINLQELPVDLLSMSAHKIYGPKGVGALFARKNIIPCVYPQMHGGTHEQGVRSGTLATHQIVGMGEACDIAKTYQYDHQCHLIKLANILIDGLNKIPLCTINGGVSNHYPGIVNAGFPFINAKELFKTLEDYLAVSVGSACNSESLETSHVLKAMGISDDIALSSLRISMGRYTSEEDIIYTIEILSQLVFKLRMVSPQWQAYQNLTA